MPIPSSNPEKRSPSDAEKLPPGYCKMRVEMAESISTSPDALLLTGEIIERRSADDQPDGGSDLRSESCVSP
jgi:hypothetical protein